MDVREHRRQAPKAGRRQPEAERGKISLEHGRQVPVEPIGASRRAGERVRRWIPSAEPSIPGEAGSSQLRHPEWRQLEESDPARQSLRGRSQETGTRGAGQHDPPLATRAIEHVPQDREQLRQPLRFVKNHSPRVRAEESFRIGLEQSAAAGPLEVELEPVRQEPADEGALPRLPGPKTSTAGKTRRRPRSASPARLGTYSMTWIL
jgi:hypothetical protein